MKYESAIKVMQSQMQIMIEDKILKAVQDAGVVVDKERLLKALKYESEQYEKGYQDGLNADKWIPVKDRLPESEGHYLTCDKKGNIHVFYHHNSMMYPFGICENHSQYYPPVAWMQLPEPYKEGE